MMLCDAMKRNWFLVFPGSWTVYICVRISNKKWMDFNEHISKYFDISEISTDDYLVLSILLE